MFNILKARTTTFTNGNKNTTLKFLSKNNLKNIPQKLFLLMILNPGNLY
tara:strand:- start:7716 stop:7862 length:147 start_codon:yes stop_codon:yes gene_type:complete